ncbi:hypothetical protein DV515_00003054 [Chloebia gouldiae]|uniref:Uncharacterized protein n=1 Tax=Chloebia gouldiae TaxID=44316 RepID=A0A3L8SVE6_CHLGU|nr:hypothetical protein DV515_00003054 [Chloebia gouldiae]
MAVSQATLGITKSCFGNRQHADPITSRAPEISTPTHSSPNVKLEVQSPQLCFASQAKLEGIFPLLRKCNNQAELQNEMSFELELIGE